MEEREEVRNALAYWNHIHDENRRENIKIDDWLDLFGNIIDNCMTPILDLGCGSGNDTLYLIHRKKKVIPCDFSRNAIDNIVKNFPEIQDAKCFNMLDGLPFGDNAFELIIADLSLHYFNEKDTIYIVRELKRILKENGHLLFRVNSVNDVNYGAGKGLEIKKHVYQTEDCRLKRFFDEEDIRYFFKDYAIEYLNEEMMTRYKLEKRLYRVCVRKKTEE